MNSATVVISRNIWETASNRGNYVLNYRFYCEFSEQL